MRWSSDVVVRCGPNEDYEGVVDPQLQPKFLQTAEEELKFKPVMDDLVANGLDVEGETISGI